MDIDVGIGIALTSFAGITGKVFHGYSRCFPCGMIDEPWVIDSGATNHMTHKAIFFVHLHSLKQPFFVILPNGSKVKAASSGTVYFNSNNFT